MQSRSRIFRVIKYPGIEESKPYFTHKGAEELVTKLKSEIDEYASRYGIHADKIWKEEYLK